MKIITILKLKNNFEVCVDQGQGAFFKPVQGQIKNEDGAKVCKVRVYNFKLVK